MRFRTFALFLATAVLLSGQSLADDHGVNGRRAGDVDTARVQKEVDSGENWLVNGRTFTGEHYSPLDQIHDANVKKLGLAWATDIPSGMGLTAEPIVVDGVAYLSGTLSHVWALDAATGDVLWFFDPEVRLDISYGNSASARYNRGVAVWKGKVFVGTGDCRVVAIDAAKGTKLWDAPVCDPADGDGTGVTAAPRVANNMVFMGYLGSDMMARGALVALHAETGKEAWRFWTVPGDPEVGRDTKELETARKTWTGGWAKTGGGVVWEEIRYDPETHSIIFGTAAASPINVAMRGPGDNLFTNSVIAVDADSGAYKWHYQTTPEDAWDYDATMPKVITDLKFNGKSRRVVLEAPKNGFFYVIDARSGELISADPIAKVTWASHIDMETGRPVVVEAAKYYENKEPGARTRVWPSTLGAHNWQPMSFSPKTRLIYIPVTDMPTNLSIGGYVGARDNVLGYELEEKLPSDVGQLMAWDPVARKAVWTIDHPMPWNGGVLATAGNLVFQGTGTGAFSAYSADTGKRLWSRKTGSSIQAQPVSYAVGGQQYVLVPIGKGGGIAGIANIRVASRDARGPARLLAFKLGAKGQIPITPFEEPPVPKPPARTANTEEVQRGAGLFVDYGCHLCHGGEAMGWESRQRGNGAIPDLRYIPASVHEEWQGVVLGGNRRIQGMPDFVKAGMTPEDSEAIHAYVIEQSWKAYEGKGRGPHDN